MKFNFKCVFGFHSWKKHIERKIGSYLSIICYYCKRCDKQRFDLFPPEDNL